MYDFLLFDSRGKVGNIIIILSIRDFHRYALQI